MKEYKNFGELRKVDFEEAVVVFTEDSFQKKYTEEERSYKFSKQDNPFFKEGLISNRLTADCLDGKDKCVRLDYYLGEWEIEKIYIVK